MQKQRILCRTVPSGPGGNVYSHIIRGISLAAGRLSERKITELCHLSARISCKHINLNLVTQSSIVRPSKIQWTAIENIEAISDGDDKFCPVDCVKEFHTNEELLRIKFFSCCRLLPNFLWRLHVHRARVCKIMQGIWGSRITSYIFEAQCKCYLMMVLICHFVLKVKWFWCISKIITREMNEYLEMFFFEEVRNHKEHDKCPILIFLIISNLSTYQFQPLQVIDEYDEQSEVADRLRIKIILTSFI